MPSTSRRRFLGSSLALLSAPYLATTRKSQAANPSRPNLLFLLSDDQRADSLGCAGNPIVQTPNIDRLTGEGVMFTNNFCTTAICCTSRASFLTGRYGSTMDLHRFDRALPEDAWRNSYPMLLREAGYRTGFIGKFGIGDPLPVSDFDYWKGFPGQGRYLDREHPDLGHLTRRMGHQALEFLDGCRGEQPFCLSMSFKSPHVQDEAQDHLFPPDPMDEPLYRDVTIPSPKLATEEAYLRLPEFLRESEGHVRWKTRFATPEMFQSTVKDIYRLITGMDRAIGEVMQELRERGLDGNTVVVFTSDNGFFFNERLMEGKWLMYEDSIRTPLVIRDPRLPEGLCGRRLSPMSLNIDVAPTLLALAGLPVPESMAGRSLVPLLRGERPLWRQEWYYEHLLDHPHIPRCEGVRSESWKYIRYIDTNPVYEELYDLDSDPYEEKNLASVTGNEDQLRMMRERCDKLRGSIR